MKYLFEIKTPGSVLEAAGSVKLTFRVALL